MKKYRKLSAFLLALTLCISLSACGSTDSSNTASDASTTTEITTEAETTTETNINTDNSRPGDPPDGDRPDAPPDGNGGGPGGGGPGGSSSADIDYKGTVEITSSDSQSGQNYNSSTSDESALLISTSDNVTITDPTVNKTGDSDGGDNCNFYGLNAAVLVKDGSNTSITGGTITSDADGANGVFCYGGNGGQNGATGDGTTLTIRDTVIKTTGDGSGGIMTTGGGITYAYDLDVDTSGQSSAAIRTDRGGGTVYVNGGTYTSNGLGSPAIYSTAEIHVENATLTSNLSEGVCIEGKNSIELTNCNMTANNTKCNGNATFFDTIMIYQSMSGDADSGTSSFTMTGGTLTSKNGHVFHVTNTNAVINLNGVTIKNEDSENILLSVCADGWSGAGNIATLNADGQELSGIIKVGSDSELTLSLTNGSTFTGSIDGSITNAQGTSVSTEVGTVNVKLDSTSKWTLTADTHITSFDGDVSNIITNGYTLYVNGTALT
ncbi:hypothetical protein [Ruminococcus sp.]|uniref:hypothetical protein n=1 Tax=Ruminococcus sp. TaxID=41978 RepID=UPI0025ECCB91|nr:hypothetical protein [Ruminococcus sp.]MBQ6252190.1 hypothetical protein [Ruminococcus sp.]